MYLMEIGRETLTVDTSGAFRMVEFWLVLLKWMVIHWVRPTAWEVRPSCFTLEILIDNEERDALLEAFIKTMIIYLLNIFYRVYKIEYQ